MKKIRFRRTERKHSEYGGYVEYYLAYKNRCYSLHITDLEFRSSPYIRAEVARTLLRIRKELRQIAKPKKTMTPLIEILLAVATFYPDASDPFRGPVEMLEGDYDQWNRVLDAAIAERYVRENPPMIDYRWTLSTKGRAALFSALKDA